MQLQYGRAQEPAAPTALGWMEIVCWGSSCWVVPCLSRAAPPVHSGDPAETFTIIKQPEELSSFATNAIDSICQGDAGEEEVLKANRQVLEIQQRLQETTKVIFLPHGCL